MTKIPKERKAVYYVGMVMMILGFLLFMSVFFSVARMFSGHSMSFTVMSFLNPIWGILLMIFGSLIMNIGARGAAGSGMILDPEKAREDLRPFNEAKGEMINDVISNIDVVDQLTGGQQAKEIIKIRCRNCSALNEEDAKFCKSCGQQL